MHGRPTSNIWKYFVASVSEEDRRNKRNKRKVWECKRKTNGDGKDLRWIKSKIPEGNKKSQQLYREIDRLNQAKQTSEEVIKSLRNLTSIRIESVPDEENKLNHLQKNLERERNPDTRQRWTKERNNTNPKTTTENANGKCSIKKRNNADQSKTTADTNRVQWKDKWDQ